MSIPKIPTRRHFANQDEIDIDIPDGDPIMGKSLFEIHCAGCHNLNDNGNMGPRLRYVFMRKAGTIKNYFYSKTLQGEDPEAMIPDTQMSFEGMNDPWMRACIIEYLHFLKDQKK